MARSRLRISDWNRIALLAVSLAGGCTGPYMLMGGWSADYPAAERRMRGTDNSMLIYYRNDSVRRQDRMEERFKEPELRRRLRDFVRCKLFRTYEPHRRYVAQYGVDRAPALIVIKPDGTYHAREGLMRSDEMLAFLEAAESGGHVARKDRLLPRETSYEWYDSRAKAEEAAAANGSEVLFVLTEPLTSQWSRLKEILERREVHTRTGNMTACRLSSWSQDAREIAEKAGVTSWPAVVLCHKDGTLDALEDPASYEEVCRFMDRHGRRP